MNMAVALAKQKILDYHQELQRYVSICITILYHARWL